MALKNYKVTAKRANGTTFTDTFYVANEREARADFRACYRHGDYTIVDVALDEPDTVTDAELLELVKIAQMKPAEGSGNELKPCPFCGGEEIVFMQYEHAAGPRWKVFCCGCAAGIDPGWAQAPHSVATLWNRRQPDTNTKKEEA